jgi:hypothetical protein
MDEIIKGFYDYGIYIISSLVILSAILAIIVSSAKECPYPAECFDCSDTSCSECYHLSMYKKHKQAKPATKSTSDTSCTHLRFTLAMVYNYTNQKKISELKNMRRPKHTVKMAITFVSILIEQHLLCKFKLGAKRFPAYDIFYLFPISRWFPLIWRWPGGVKKLHWGTRMLRTFHTLFRPIFKIFSHFLKRSKSNRDNVKCFNILKLDCI